MNKKQKFSIALMSAVLLTPVIAGPTAVYADDFYSNQTNAQRADITNWVANTPDQIGNNMQAQGINVNDLHGARYIIQWGDTLSGISAETGISVQKLAYDNNIQNVNLIYAGDVLILNSDGSVPSGYNITGNPNQVASTKVVINNNTNNQNVTIDNSVVNINQSISNNYPSASAGSSSSLKSGNSSSSSSSSSSASSSSDENTNNGQMSSEQFQDAVESAINQHNGVDIKFSDNVSGGHTTTGTIDFPVKRTSANAKRVADVIVMGLKSSGYLDDANKASAVNVQLQFTGSKCHYSVSIGSSNNSSSSSSSASN